MAHETLAVCNSVKKCLIFPETTLYFAQEYGHLSTLRVHPNIPVWPLGLKILTEERVSKIMDAIT